MKRSLTTRTMTAAGGRGPAAAAALDAGLARGTTGKLTGRVTDEAKAPLAGVNVTIPAARLGRDHRRRRPVPHPQRPGRHLRREVRAARLPAARGRRTWWCRPTDHHRATRRSPSRRSAMPEVVVSARRPVVDLYAHQLAGLGVAQGDPEPAGAGADGRRQPPGRRRGRTTSAVAARARCSTRWTACR